MLKWFKKLDKKPTPPFTNEEWVRLLKRPPEEYAVEELRKLLVRGLKPSLSKYIDRELEPFVEDVAQDSLLKILDNVQTFRGESKFITWAMKIAVREGLTKLRRKRWDDISIEDLKGPGHEEDSGEINKKIFATGEPSPELSTAQKMVLEQVQEIISEILTEKQRTAIKGVMIDGLSITVVADQMNTNRNNLYKLIHDARKKIKNEFEVRGINPEKMLNELSNE